MPTFKKRLIDIISFSNRPTTTFQPLLKSLFDFDFSQPGMAHSTPPVVCDEVKSFALSSSSMFVKWSKSYLGFPIALSCKVLWNAKYKEAAPVLLQLIQRCSYATFLADIIFFASFFIVSLVIIPPLRYQAKVEGKVRLATGKALASAPEKEVFADCKRLPSHTGQEQACTRITRLFGCSFVTMPKMAQYRGKWLLTAP